MMVLAESRTAALAICTSLLLAVTGPATAQDYPPIRDHLQLGLGYFDIYDQTDGAIHAVATYRPGMRALEFSAKAGDAWQGIGPQIGVGFNNEGGKLAHAGFFLDLRPFENVVVWPGANVGAWDEHDSRDLGGTLQFMTEFYIGYRLPWDALVGVSVQHISNAGIHDNNPGGDLAMVTYTVSFGPWFGN